MSQTSSGKKAVRKKSARTLPVNKATPRRSDIHPLDRAISELRAELARSPDDPTLLGRLGALFYRRGDVAEAEAIYRRAIAIAPNRPNLYNNLGNVLCDLGRMREGIGAYEHAMAVEKANNPERPASPEAAANLEMARMEYRLIHERIEYLERASQLDVTSAESLNTLGCGYLLRGERMKALDTFRKAAVMNPRNVFAALNIAFAHTLNLSGNLDLKSALSEVAESIMRFPHEGRLHIHQGELLENAGLLEGAEERYLRAIQADPRCLEAYDLLNRLRDATGFGETIDETAHAADAALLKLENHARELRQRSGQAGNAQALFDLAFVEVVRSRLSHRAALRHESLDTLLREAASAGAAESKEVANSKNSVAAQASILRAQLLETDGRPGEARVVLEQASATHPEHARLWYERGSLAMHAGEVDEALAGFDRATLCEPQDAVAYHSLRFVFEGFRRYKTERVRFETASKANPRDGLAHHHMGMAAQSVLKNEEALFHFTRGLELDPRLSDSACGRGRTLQRLGHLEEAEEAYVKALAIDPENTEAHRSLVALRSQKLLPRK